MGLPMAPTAQGQPIIVSLGRPDGGNGPLAPPGTRSPVAVEGRRGAPGGRGGRGGPPRRPRRWCRAGGWSGAPWAVRAEHEPVEAVLHDVLDDTSTEAREGVARRGRSRPAWRR